MKKKIVTSGQFSSAVLTQTELDYLAEQIKKHGVLLKGHFVLKSGEHSGHYLNKDKIYIHSDLISALCQAIASQFEYDGIDVVIAPAIGGVILSHIVAGHLSKICGREIPGIYAEKSGDGKTFVIKRNYDKLVSGKKILVLEDVVTTGGSVREVVKIVRACGGNVIGLAAICNRKKVTRRQVGNPMKFISLIDMNLESWANESICPLCKNAIMINTSIGHGTEFLKSHPEWVTNEMANSD